MDFELAASSATTASEVARRYAGALFTLASETDMLSAVAADLKVLVDMASGSEDLQLLLNSPAFQTDEKVKGLTEVARKAGLNETIVRFIGTLAQNGRANELVGAAIAFDELYAEHRGIRRAVAITATKMKSTQRKKLEKLLAQGADGNVELHEEVNPALIGGIQLRLGSTLIDASVASKLNRMNIAMKGA